LDFHLQAKELSALSRQTYPHSWMKNGAKTRTALARRGKREKPISYLTPTRDTLQFLVVRRIAFLQLRRSPT